ncbi:MAG TPA: hypothetical protein ENG70_02525 [Candidatus Cloacimonetes bacterium]|nr:hypothetical protein [Candidatus Cloacimonadota bacterium]HEX37719.1 hypothetical protein [Candidatus Cloacimonadota bacterium]
MKKPVKKIAGYSLIGLGIAGLFLPFLQGILFIILGLGLVENKKLNKFFYDIKQKINQKLHRKKVGEENPFEELERDD